MRIGNNRTMNLSDEAVAQIEAKLREIAELDAADLPQPAAELAELLGTILDEVDSP
jgi:hypothetical protein